MQKNETETFCPTSRQEWREWLIENHVKKQSVWLAQHKKKSNKPSISWSDSVDEALCFGWIDSVRKTVDADTYIQFFSKRKPKGTWSKINKDKIIQLIDAGLMAKAGFESIEKAKQNGSWTILDEVEELTVPTDLETELKANPVADEYFQNLSKSVKKLMLQRLVFAKRPETRQKRITEILELAVKN
jgi:uncharacterized protein YdeI (YjbR/CyaY-like superfamily)